MFSSIKPAVKPLRCSLLFCVCVRACKISRNSKGFFSKQSSLGLFFTPLYLSKFSSLFGGLFTACLLGQDISSTKAAPPRKHLWDTSTWNRAWHEGVSPGVSGEHLSTWMRRELVIPWGRDSKSGGGGPLPRELAYEADLREGQEAGSRGRTQETKRIHRILGRNNQRQRRNHPIKGNKDQHHQPVSFWPHRLQMKDLWSRGCLQPHLHVLGPKHPICLFFSINTKILERF